VDNIIWVGCKDTLRRHPIPLFVLMRKVKPQPYNDYDQQAVAPKMGCEGDEVPWAIPV
jgi:hypothetical protein